MSLIGEIWFVANYLPIIYPPSRVFNTLLVNFYVKQNKITIEESMGSV